MSDPIVAPGDDGGSGMCDVEYYEYCLKIDQENIRSHEGLPKNFMFMIKDDITAGANWDTKAFARGEFKGIRSASIR